jgi:hypothetical protein
VAAPPTLRSEASRELLRTTRSGDERRHHRRARRSRATRQHCGHTWSVRKLSSQDHPARPRGKAHADRARAPAARARERGTCDRDGHRRAPQHRNGGSSARCRRRYETGIAPRPPFGPTRRRKESRSVTLKARRCEARLAVARPGLRRAPGLRPGALAGVDRTSTRHSRNRNPGPARTLGETRVFAVHVVRLSAQDAQSELAIGPVGRGFGGRFGYPLRDGWIAQLSIFQVVFSSLRISSTTNRPYFRPRTA